MLAVWLGITLRGCFLHYTQALWRTCKLSTWPLSTKPLAIIVTNNLCFTPLLTNPLVFQDSLSLPQVCSNLPTAQPPNLLFNTGNFFPINVETVIGPELSVRIKCVRIKCFGFLKCFILGTELELCFGIKCF